MDQIFLLQAINSANRSEKASEKADFETELGESASAIVFAALSTEAIISEYLTHFEFSSAEIPEPLMKLRRTLDPMHKWKTLLKFENPDIDLGSGPEFQKLKCLMDLRNSIVHRQARLLKPNEYPKELETYMRLKILPRPSEFRGSWILTLLNFHTAKWAVSSANDWIQFSSDFVAVREEDV